MKMTKKRINAFVRAKLATNSAWALRALVRVYENQTSQEQSAEATLESNGIGFTGTDGEFLTSLAKQFLSRGTLSVKQMQIVFRLMPKYSRQVIAAADTEKLTKMCLNS